MISKITNTGEARVLLCIDDRVNYASELARTTGMTYAHTTKIIQEIKLKGYVEKLKEGRIITVLLTEKGQRIRELLKEIQLIEQ